MYKKSVFLNRMCLNPRMVEYKIKINLPLFKIRPDFFFENIFFSKFSSLWKKCIFKKNIYIEENKDVNENILYQDTSFLLNIITITYFDYRVL